MNSRPAGYSSNEEDEDDDFGDFSFHGDIKSEKEKQEEIAAEIYHTNLELKNTSTNRLYSAITNRNLEAAIKILDNELDVNCHVINDWTPLFLASSLGYPVIVEELLKRGADANCSSNGVTCLMAVCECSKMSTTSDKIASVVEHLIKSGADVEAIDRKKRTALMLASSQGFLEVVSLFLSFEGKTLLEAEDNQRWTALFYGVNANEPDIVKLLLDNGANVNHIDVRDNDVKYYATLNDYQEILKILSSEDNEITIDYLTNNFTNDYENIFKHLENNEKPDFINDISFILYGMKCQNLLSILLNENTVNLSTFLTLDQTKLAELNVKLSFQQNRILQGLYSFHVHRWKKSSVPLISKNCIYTTYDMFVACANVVKHLIVMEASIRYLKQNFLYNESSIDKKLLALKISQALKKINHIKHVAKLLNNKADKIDKVLYGQGTTDLISKDYQFKRNQFKHKILFGCVCIFGISIVRYYVFPKLF